MVSAIIATVSAEVPGRLMIGRACQIICGTVTSCEGGLRGLQLGGLVVKLQLKFLCGANGL